MARLSTLLISVALLAPAMAQSQSRVAVEQIGVRRALPPRSAAPAANEAGSLGAALVSTRPAPTQTDALTPELRAACQAGVAPPGVRCPQASGNAGNGRPPGTAEGTLLQIFGVPRGFTTTPAGQSLEPADAIAQDLAAERARTQLRSDEAGAVARQRSSPPPTPPR